jgi:hypothetical protein
MAWRLPRWALPAALCGVVAITSADVVLMRRHPLSVRPQVMPEKISLRADAEGEGVRVQWNRKSRQVVNADHATLLIQDGTQRSRLDLTGRQLDGSTVMYLPQTEGVSFRLEVYRSGQSSSDSADVELPKDNGRRRHQGPARAIVEQARPSPFEHTAPEIVVTQTLPPPVVPVNETAVTPERTPEPPKESRLDRFISKIPLFRRLRKHPPVDETQSRW